MIQPDLFGPEARARNTDPDTSHDAAASVDRLRDRQAAVLAVLVDYGPSTDTTLIANYVSLAVDGHVPTQSSSGIRTRRKELVDRGLVKDSGRREVLISGRQSIVWEAVP